jgi:hypothetical protein
LRLEGGIPRSIARNQGFMELRAIQFVGGSFVNDGPNAVVIFTDTPGCLFGTMTTENGASDACN